MNPITEHKVDWLEKITLQPHYEPHKGPIKDSSVPLWTNFNANGSVRLHTSVYLNLWGKILIIGLGFVGTLEFGQLTDYLFVIILFFSQNMGWGWGKYFFLSPGPPLPPALTTM